MILEFDRLDIFSKERHLAGQTGILARPGTGGKVRVGRCGHHDQRQGDAQCQVRAPFRLACLCACCFRSYVPNHLNCSSALTEDNSCRVFNVSEHRSAELVPGSDWL